MEENTMKYNYGVTPNFNESTTIKAPQLLSLIERDVKQGKWNIYEGGDKKHYAKISYKGKTFTYGEHIFLKGSPREIQFLENKLQKILKVTPRKF